VTTKLAINLLTQSLNSLAATLAGLGLLGNGETINTLKQKLDLIIKSAFEEQHKLSSKVDIIDEKILQSNEKLGLAVSHYTTEQERLLNLKKEQGEMQIAVKTLEDKKKILGTDGNGKKADIQNEIVAIKDNIKKTETEIKKIEGQITDGVNLVARYGSLLYQAKTAQDNADYHGQFTRTWGIVGYDKRRRGFKIYHVAVEGWITNQAEVNLRDQYQNQANQLNAEANNIQSQVDDFNKNEFTLQKNKGSKNAELWLYIHELDAKQNLLLFVGTQSDNELALVDLQIQQAQEDLQQLQITEIPNQEKAVEGTNRRVIQIQSELDRLRSDKGSAQKDLDIFVKDNQELLTTDLSLGLLKDAIAKVQGTIANLQGDLAKPNQSVNVIDGLNKQIGVAQGKLAQLKQQSQFLALEELGVNQERLESLNGQLASEVSVNGGVKINTIEGYVVLVPQLVQQLTGLSDIWVGNLKENHRCTVEVNDLFLKDIATFENLTDYIGDNLADPYEDYVLNKVQLDEAIALQDSQVKYRDALAKAVDDLGENIALQKKSVQQSDELSGKLEHIRDLIRYEKDYVLIKSQSQPSNQDYTSSIRTKLINKLDEELTNRIADLPNQIELSLPNNISTNPANNHSYVLVTNQDTLTRLINLGGYIVRVDNELERSWLIDKFGTESFWLKRLLLPEIYKQYEPPIDEANPRIIEIDSQQIVDYKLDQQEQSIETYLQKYVEDTQNKILDAKNQQLKSVDVTQTNLAFSSQQDGFNAFNITFIGFGLGYDNRHRFMADVNGDGRADFGRFEGGGNGTPISLYFNLAGENGFTNLVYQLTPGTDIGYDNRHRFMADVNGDGRADFGRFVGGGNGAPIFLSFNLAGENGFTNQSYQLAPGTDIGYDNRHRFMADVNGDGRADFGRFVGGGNGAPIFLSFNLAGENGFTNQSYQLAPSTDIGYDNRHRFMADVNGDGRADFGRFVGGGNGTPISLSFNLAGEIGFTNQIYQLTPGTDIGYDNLPRFMTDVNGDGRADFGRFVGGGNGTSIYLSFILAGENGFSSNQYAFNTINAGFDKGYDNRDRFMADVNGDGRADFGRFVGGGNGTHIYLSFNLTQSPQSELELIQPIEEQAISNLKNLRLETAYLTLQAEKDPDKLNNYLQKYQSILNTKDKKLASWQESNQPTIDGTFNVKASFTPGPNYLVKANNYNYQIGDFNGDGKTDLIHFDVNNYVHLWYSQGDGTFTIKNFTPGGGYGVGVSNYNYKTGDFNGDGKTDLIHFDVNNYVHLWYSQGDGSFAIKNFTPGGGYGVGVNNYNYKTGDFNGDGKTDLIHFDVNNYVHLWYSQGDGSFAIKNFTPGGNYEVGANNYNYQTGDFNGDGKTDLIHFVNSGKGYVVVWLSKGDGDFDVKSSFTPNPSYGVNNNNFNYKTGDFNGDGKTDLVHFIDPGNGYVNVWNSNGDGTFDVKQSFTPSPSYGVNNNNFNYKVGDFDGDGKTDLIHFIDPGNGYVDVWNSNGDSKTTIETEANTAINNLRTQYYPDLNQADTLSKLLTQINKEIGESEKQIEELKDNITQKQAQSNAALAQAEWYEKQAKIHLELSHKQGPTWVEWRIHKTRTRWGKVKNNLVPVTHVDHDWIIWNTYTQQAAALKQHSTDLLQGIATDTTNQNTASDILKQWQAANAVADETALTQAQLTTLLNQLEANRQLTADKKKQIADWEKLLPTLQSQLQQSVKDAEIAKNTVTQEWTEYQTSQQDYQTALGEVLTRRAQLQTQGQILLQEINAVNQWVNQQNTLLADEISQVETLITQLTTQRDAIALTPLDKAGDENLTKKALLVQSIQLLTQKQTVLTSQQSTFIQKQTLLETQKKVIQTQYQLLDAYLDSPDNDTSSLEKLLTDTRATLLEVQKLAEQAEARSNALTALMDDVQTSLLLQNDKYLSAIKDKQETLQDLLKAAELKENDTLKATQKQLELNNLEAQLIPILQKAKDAGSQEAVKLLEVAAHNNFATVAELYYRDYKDLASDQGGGCAGGIARPEDLQLANYYYGEMLKYRQLKAEAGAQVAEFTQIRTLADSQVAAIQQQQTLAAQELAQLNKNIGNSQEQIEAKQEELAIAQFRIDALAQIRNWTEQTVAQLLSVETLNLAQAQLEQNIAQNRQYLIDNTVKAALDKQRLDIERDRQIAVTKLEQLNQINTEKALLTAINDLRSDLGVNPLEDIIQQAEYKGQLAGILADLDTLKQQQPNLPDSLNTLLTATTKDIHSALQGKEAKTIQGNLLNTATALIEQSNKLNIEVTKLDQEEQKYIGLLKQSETDLKGATKALYEEIQRSGVLDKEKQLINVQNLEILYRIGYAQGAVDLSSQLAKESQQILSQIIEGRIAERKVRKKAFVNELLGTATLIIAVAATAITAGAALSAYAGVIAAGGTTAAASTAATAAIAANASIVTTLQTVGASLSAVQYAYNDDWKGAIFNAGMAALGAAELGGIQLPDIGLTNAVKDLGYQSFEGFQNFGQVRQFASGVYNGYQAIESGNTLAGFTSIVQAALVPFKESSYSYLYRASSSIYSGVELVKEDNLLGATSSFLNAVFTLGSNLSKTLGEHFSVSKDVLDIISNLELGVNAASAIKNVLNNDSLEGWLSGIQQVSDGFINYVNENTPPPPPQTPIDLEQFLNIEDAIDRVNQEFQKLKESANGDKIKIDALSQIEFQIVTSLKQNKGALKQADFEAFRINFLSNTDVNVKQFSETLNFFKAKGIEAFHNAENDDLKKYYSEEYPNYKQLPGHHKAVAIMSIMTGIDPKVLSDYLPGLGITGVKGFNWYSSFSDKILLGTALHDVTDFLDDALKNQGIDSWNKSVWGISNSTVSALKMFSDAVGKEVSDVVKETVQSALKPINYTTKLLDPLIVDLSNDGLQLISLDISSTRFDIDGDGYAENTAWVSPQDGILTIDLNHDGTINNITEIFSERYNNGTAKSGIEALATLDSNHNGIISAADQQFNQILVWQDLNQDGISQPDELKTLTQLGITSITLSGITTETLQDGNIIRTRSIFNRNDGTLGQIADVAFLVTETGFKVIQTPNGIQIIAENNSATSLSIFNDDLNHTLNLADAKVQVAIGSTGNDNFYTTASEGVFLSGGEGNDTLTGGSGSDWIIGDTGADQLFGKAGNDILYIDAQDTKIDGGEGQDIAIVATSQAVTLDLGLSNLETALGNDGNDTFTNSGAVNVVIDGGKGNDTLQGGARDDVLHGGEGDDKLYGADGNDQLYGNEGNDELHGWKGSDTLYGGSDNDILYGQQDNDFLYGEDGDDQLQGNEGNDEIQAGNGSDSLYGGSGDDKLYGNSGDDKLYGEDGSDQLYGNEGNDELHGWDGADTIYGGTDNDTLYGHQGNDSLFGDAGDDKLYGDPGDDVIQGGEGLDWLYGNVGNDTLKGNEGNDVLYGEDGNDYLYGNEGNDELYGNLGNDVLEGSDGDDKLFGEEGADSLNGGTGNDTLDGGAGIDTLIGGLGNDIYQIDSTTDIITELANQGTDTIQSAVTFSFANLANIENLTLTGSGNLNATGNTANNMLTGNSGINILNGGAGIDTLIGGLGNDIYQVDGTTDIITELANQGTDTIQSSVTFSLSNLANIENLTLTGSGNLNATGNTANNILTGNSGINILNGGAGIDTLIGGLGNDIYQVDSATDTITELTDQGIDTIQSSVTFSLAALPNIENLTLTSSAAINGTGNTLNNTLTGNSANNTLNGGEGNDMLNGSAGIDTLVGGLGNDTYQVDSTTDTITELANQGTDTIQSSVTYSVVALTQVENLTLTGSSAINGTGNTANNTIIGNNANNILSGKAGKDTLTGGGGSDRFDYKTLTDSLLANLDVITGFNANPGNDLLLVTTARSGFTNAGAVTALTATEIGSNLTPANFAANYAAQFTLGTRTFVAINDATAGFNATTDALIEVTSLTGTLNLNNFVTI